MIISLLKNSARLEQFHISTRSWWWFKNLHSKTTNHVINKTKWWYRIFLQWWHRIFLFLIFGLISHNDVFKWSCDFMVGSPSLYLTTLQTFRHCGKEDKRFLICYMISEDHVLCGFMGGSSLSFITPLPCSMTKDLVAVEI